MARYEAKLDIGGEFEASFSLPLFTGDSGNSVALEFYNRGKAYDMSGAMIYARRADGTVLATSGVSEGNKVEFVLYNNMYLYPGELQVQVTIVDVYGNFLTSGVLYFTVQEGFSEQSEGEGSNDFCELTSLIRQVGEGLTHIERAESAANEIESFLQLVEKPENSVIHQLSESEIDTFIEGCAIVTSYNSTDLVTGTQKWLLFASCTSGLLIDHYELSQLRYYENKLQTRKGTYFQGLVGGWEYSWDDWSDEIPDNLISYKGSVDFYSQLPTEDNSVGDVWNVVYPSEISIKANPFTVDIVEYDDESDEWVAVAPAGLGYDGMTEVTGIVYNSNGIMLGVGYTDMLDNLRLAYKIEPGNYYIHFTDESPSKYNTDTVKSYKTGDNCKFIWNGSEWQTLTGNMSMYATKEELGDMEVALDAIIAIQDSLIQEGA